MLIWIFIFVLAFFLLWTIVNSFFMPSLPESPAVKKEALLSVLVPMRNEEKNVRALIADLKKSTYPHTEFIILNDQSTDNTQQLLEEETKGDSRFTLLQGAELPAG